MAEMGAGRASADATVDAQSRRVVVAAGYGLLAAAVVAAVVFWALGLTQTDDLNPWDETKKPDLYGMVRSTAGITAVLGAAVGLVLALRKQQSTEQTTKLAVERHDLDAVAALRDRYTTAAGQLGDESPVVRLAGVYALAALADDWAERDDRAEIQTCVNVLCSYLRTPRTYETEVDRTADREVRQSIVRVITAHVQPAAPRHWRDRDFDFTNAEFDFTVSFYGATFSGKTSFDRAMFSGNIASFDRATFSGNIASFDKATFSGKMASFDGATFSGDITWFDGVTFDGGRASFMAAMFSGKMASFDGATFSGKMTSFDRVTFSNTMTSFDGVTFSGERTSFDGVTFDGGGRTGFDGATFSGKWTSFHVVTFSGETTSFYGATFSGETTLFDGATFSGENTSFDRATFSGERTSFDGATFSGEKTSFHLATFSGEKTSFDRATFSGEKTSFDWATFTGRHASLRSMLLGDPATQACVLRFGVRVGPETTVSFHNGAFVGSAHINFDGLTIEGPSAAVVGPWNSRRPQEAWPVPSNV